MNIRVHSQSAFPSPTPSCSRGGRSVRKEDKEDPLFCFSFGTKSFFLASSTGMCDVFVFVFLLFIYILMNDCSRQLVSMAFSHAYGS